MTKTNRKVVSEFYRLDDGSRLQVYQSVNGKWCYCRKDATAGTFAGNVGYATFKEALDAGRAYNGSSQD